MLDVIGEKKSCDKKFKPPSTFLFERHSCQMPGSVGPLLGLSREHPFKYHKACRSISSSGTGCDVVFWSVDAPFVCEQWQRNQAHVPHYCGETKL